MDTITNLKLIDAGVSKDDIMFMTTVMTVFRIVIPIPLAKYTGGPKPLSFYLKFMPIRYKKIYILILIFLNTCCMRPDLTHFYIPFKMMMFVFQITLECTLCSDDLLYAVFN